MKDINEYLDKSREQLWKDTGAFFAFNNEQFEEGYKEELKPYVNCGMGLICPERNVKALIEGLSETQKRAIELRKSEYSAEDIIMYELGNYECWYTGDIDPAVNALTGYGYSREQISELFVNRRAKEIDKRE